MQPTAKGIVPINIIITPVTQPNVYVIPLKQFESNLKEMRLDINPTVLGIVPNLNTKYLRHPNLDSTQKIPIREFEFNAKYCKFTNDPIELGILPIGIKKHEIQ